MTQDEFRFDTAATAVKLSRQQRLVVERFKRQGGRATNVDLAEVCLRYGSRLHELRQKGYDVSIVERQKHGVMVYELKGGVS